ncbi:ribosome-inactivating family protein [Streptomyces sp. NPDC059002]|uniref:InlB B-repeat-containing protein n=1 Tax=Streptomyces sp. NPDC059002 TaxID=3346690 RepID=UPI00369C6CA3
MIGIRRCLTGMVMALTLLASAEWVVNAQTQAISARPAASAITSGGIRAANDQAHKPIVWSLDYGATEGNRLEYLHVIDEIARSAVTHPDGYTTVRISAQGQGVVDVFIRNENLYLTGYFAHGRDGNRGQAYHFAGEQQIPGAQAPDDIQAALGQQPSRSMGYKADYGSLATDSVSIESPQFRIDPENLPYQVQRLVRARRGSDVRLDDEKGPLLRFVVALSEGTRFRTVSDRIGAGLAGRLHFNPLDPVLNLSPSVSYIEVIKKWDRLSEMLRDPAPGKFLEVRGKKIRTKDILDADLMRVMKTASGTAMAPRVVNSSYLDRRNRGPSMLLPVGKRRYEEIFGGQSTATERESTFPGLDGEYVILDRDEQKALSRAIGKAVDPDKGERGAVLRLLPKDQGSTQVLSVDFFGGEGSLTYYEDVVKLIGAYYDVPEGGKVMDALGQKNVIVRIPGEPRTYGPAPASVAVVPQQVANAAQGVRLPDFDFVRTAGASLTRDESEAKFKEAVSRVTCGRARRAGRSRFCGGVGLVEVPARVQAAVEAILSADPNIAKDLLPQGNLTRASTVKAAQTLKQRFNRLAAKGLIKGTPAALDLATSSLDLYQVVDRAIEISKGDYKDERQRKLDYIENFASLIPGVSPMLGIQDGQKRGDTEAVVVNSLAYLWIFLTAVAAAANPLLGLAVGSAGAVGFNAYELAKKTTERMEGADAPATFPADSPLIGKPGNYVFDLPPVVSLPEGVSELQKPPGIACTEKVRGTEHTQARHPQLEINQETTSDPVRLGIVYYDGLSGEERLRLELSPGGSHADIDEYSQFGEFKHLGGDWRLTMLDHGPKYFFLYYRLGNRLSRKLTQLSVDWMGSQANGRAACAMVASDVPWAAVIPFGGKMPEALHGTGTVRVQAQASPVEAGQVKAEPVPQSVSPSKARVSLVATPGPGYRFVRWARKDGKPLQILDGRKQTDPVIYLEDESVTVTGEFEKCETGCLQASHMISVTSDGGGSVNVEPPSRKPGGLYPEGTSLTVSALPYTGYRFAGWYSGEGKYSDESRIALKVANDLRLRAKFSREPLVTVTLSMNPKAGNIAYDTRTGERNIGGKLSTGSTFSVEARHFPGFRFVRWLRDGAEVSRSPQYELTAQEDVTLTAEFTRTKPPEPSGPQLTFHPSPSAGGRIAVGHDLVSPDASRTFKSQDQLSFTAVPARGYHFDKWEVSGGQLGSWTKGANSPCAVPYQVAKNASVTARFSKKSSGGNGYKVKFPQQEGGKVIAHARADGIYDAWDEVCLSAQPDPGYRFVGWKEEGTPWSLGSEAEYLYRVTKDASVLAEFARK